MKEFRKWFLVGLILVLVIGWNVSCGKDEIDEFYFLIAELKSESQPIIENCVDDFLNKILARILQKIPKHKRYSRCRFTIKIEPGDPDWAIINITKLIWDSKVRIISGDIPINKKSMLLIENEAEVAAVIAHEVAHIVFYKEKREKRKKMDHADIDYIGIKLMARAGYNTFCTVDIIQRMVKEIGLENKKKERMVSMRKNAKKYFRKNQKKWILFTPEDLEKVKEFLKAGN